MTRSPKPRKPTRKPLTVLRDLEHLRQRLTWYSYAQIESRLSALLSELRQVLKQPKAR